MITLVALTFAACSEKSKTEAEKAGDQIENTAKAIGNDFNEKRISLLRKQKMRFRKSTRKLMISTRKSKKILKK